MAHNIRKRAPASGTPLAVVWRRIEALRPDPANPRSHNPKQIRQLTRSIGAFGFNVPILVDRTLRIIAGHGRLLAAQELGWREVPTILLDHLSEVEARAFMIADNRVAESAVWNNTLLVKQLQELSFSPDFVIETTGFELSEIDLLTGGAGFGKRKPSRRPTPRTAAAPTVASPGEWWQLGRHRVGCGSLTDAVDAMLAGGTEDAVVVLAGNPATVDTIIRRWQAATGGSARRMTSGRGFAALPGRAPDGG